MRLLLWRQPDLQNACACAPATWEAQGNLSCPELIREFVQRMRKMLKLPPAPAPVATMAEAEDLKAALASVDAIQSVLPPLADRCALCDYAHPNCVLAVEGCGHTICSLCSTLGAEDGKEPPRTIQCPETGCTATCPREKLFELFKIDGELHVWLRNL